MHQPTVGAALAAITKPRFCALTLQTGLAVAVASAASAQPILSGDGVHVAFSETVGSLTSVSASADGPPIFVGGESGLWSIRFRDNSTLSALDCSPDQVTVAQAGDTVALRFTHPQASVTVTATSGESGIDLVGEVTPREKTLLDFALPARLRFDPTRLDRFICPANGNMSVGTAFNQRFFQLQPQDSPAAWRYEAIGGAGYQALLGGAPENRPNDDPPVSLTVTQDGREWFSDALAQRLASSQAVVNRPSLSDQVDLVLIDSPNGPYLSASSLGGEGRLWRIGGAVRDEEKRLAPDMLLPVITRVARSAPEGRARLGLIDLVRGPSAGGWSAVEVDTWRRQVGRAATSAGATLVELTTPAEVIEAAQGSDFAVILNPYGEWAPAPVDGDLSETISAIGEFVRGGGNWFEVGGYSFHYALRPVRYLSHGSSYPAAFADFFHLDTDAGSASIYRVQPLDPTPWKGAEDPSGIFVPGRLACGGDESGGYCDRPFATYVEPGRTWRCPTVRITVGNSAEDGLLDYCVANDITRPLASKMDPDTLAKFKNSVLVYYAGSCADKLAYVDQLPMPSQVHFADYLKGGFDKEYPDHLPPGEGFGTPQEFRRFFDSCHELGHLVSPYTNPTWWCDGPKGPTFEREGTDPLLKTLDGELSPERYSTNTGFTVCHWHPAVQAVNRETRRQFTEDFPVDILFQDQCGARGWRYDTNPASPTPYAYIDGLLSMIAEDSQVRPLSTEAGWDRVVNYEAQLCGLSWQIVPTEGGPSWVRPMKESVPPETWEVFPLAQYIAHDKTAMLYHDLGQFVTNREVLSWTLGLGFSLSYRISAPALEKDAPREWLRWLDRVQKSVCALYVGEPVQNFDHDRGPDPSAEGDGVMRATYGPVQVVANLGPEPLTEEGFNIPGYGFIAAAPGLLAADLEPVGVDDYVGGGTSFVWERDGDDADLWVYSPPARTVTIPVVPPLAADVTVTLDDRPAVEATVTDGKLTFALPHRPGAEIISPPPELADLAPADWPGEKPSIGIIDLGAGVNPTWTSIQPADWLQAFSESALPDQGVTVRRLTTPTEVHEALAAGPKAWLTIINPYGETFPSTGDWHETLDAIRGYVSNGGSWWETGGYSFHAAVSRDGDAWRYTSVGPSGMGALGLPVGGGEIDQAPEPLTVTPVGAAVFGDDLATQIAQESSPVNRALTRGPQDPGHVTLIRSADQDFIGAYRLNGWGYLWRIGGFHPNPSVALPTAVAATEYLYTHKPLPVPGGSVHYLWHARVTPR